MLSTVYACSVLWLKCFLVIALASACSLVCFACASKEPSHEMPSPSQGDQGQTMSSVVAGVPRNDVHELESEEAPPDFILVVRRTRCLGSCPVARTELRADGSVLYVGKRNVATLGTIELSGRADAVRAIWSRMKDLRFLELQNKYDMPGLRDAPSTIISLTANGIEKTIVNSWIPRRYIGGPVSEEDEAMHHALDLLALDIEKATGTAKLMYGY